MVFGNTWEVFKWEVLGDGQGGDGGPIGEKQSAEFFFLKLIICRIKHGL